MIFSTFQVGVYTLMVVNMPRAGADYVWQSRTLNPLLAFVMNFPSWMFITIFWVPWNTYVYGLSYISPMLVLMGQSVESANWWSGNDYIYIMSVVCMIITGLLASFGLKLYAKVQKVLYWLALIGAVIVMITLGLSSSSAFIAGHNAFYTEQLGYAGSNAYQDIIQAAKDQGFGANPVNWDMMKALPLLPLNLMWGLWPTWAAPMYGEVRGVKDVKKTYLSFQMANIPLNIMNIIIILGIWNVAGNEFFQSANYLFWMGDTTHMPLFPSVPLWVFFVTGSAALTIFVLFFNMAFYFLLNGAANTYLVISRFMFAASYDQALPSWFAELKTRWRIPVYTFAYCFLVMLVMGYIYAYNLFGFKSLFLDAAFCFLGTFCMTAVAAIVLPFRRKNIFEASPAAKYKIGGIPLQAIFAVLFIGMSIYVFYAWVVDPLYGVNSMSSVPFLIFMYTLGAIIFTAFWFYRRSKGIDLALTYQQLPPD